MEMVCLSVLEFSYAMLESNSAIFEATHLLDLLRFCYLTCMQTQSSDYKTSSHAMA